MSEYDREHTVVIPLSGRIDSESAQSAENGIRMAIGCSRPESLTLDASKLTYISSAGLRVLLRLKKEYGELSVINVSSEVYDILEMTGFTEILSVDRAYRSVSLAGCERIGSGANGAVYRLDNDTVVKVYSDLSALDEIKHERENAKLALILGLPTAISYEIVGTDEGFGSVFELLNSRSFSEILASEPDKFDWCVKEYARLLNKLHETEAPAGKLTDIKATVLSWACDILSMLPKEKGEKLTALINAVPESRCLVHGDLHTKNIMLQDGEALLIDMDTLSTGDPVFELGPVYCAFIGFYETDPEAVKSFQGFDFDTSSSFFNAALSAYLGTRCPDKLKEVTDKVRIVSYTRLLSRAVRHGLFEKAGDRAAAEYWKKELLELLDRYDTLLFDKNELILPARREKLSEALEFINERISALEPDAKARMQLEVAVEEIFVNIADYAYDGGCGNVEITVCADGGADAVAVTMKDSGLPYDPLKREDPDITLPADKRREGGLGIFLTKKLADEVSYERVGGKNTLTVFKKLRA